MLSHRRLSSRSRTRKRGKRVSNKTETKMSTEFDRFVETVRPGVVARLKILGLEGRDLVRERNRLITEMYKKQ